MQLTITLADGEHTLCTPTFYALQLMSEYGVTFDGSFDPSQVSAMLAALLTDSEPLNDKGYPEKVWTPVMAAKQLTPAGMADLFPVVTELLNDAFPDVKKADEEKPKKARPTTSRAS